MRQIFIRLLPLICFISVPALSVRAETIYAVAVVSSSGVYSDSLISFDSATPNIINTEVAVTGLIHSVPYNQDLLDGIDIRPSNGLLYGLDGHGNIYTINTLTGAATPLLSYPQLFASSYMSFNPVNGLLRVFTERRQL